MKRKLFCSAVLPILAPLGDLSAAIHEGERQIAKYAGWGAIVFGLLSLTLFLVRKSVMRTEAEAGNEMELNREMLIDPEIPELKRFSAENRGVKEMPFLLVLQDGRSFVCRAELREGLEPLVYIEGDKTPVAWGKRRQRAAKMTATKNDR